MWWTKMESWSLNHLWLCFLRMWFPLVPAAPLLPMSRSFIWFCLLLSSPWQRHDGKHKGVINWSATCLFSSTQIFLGICQQPGAGIFICLPTWQENCAPDAWQLCKRGMLLVSHMSMMMTMACQASLLHYRKFFFGNIVAPEVMSSIETHVRAITCTVNERLAALERR